VDFGESQDAAIASVPAQIMHPNAPRRSMSSLSSFDICFSFCWPNNKRTEGVAVYSRSSISFFGAEANPPLQLDSQQAEGQPESRSCDGAGYQRLAVIEFIRQLWE
jgi:hypothetical protein